jgi:hypothetical protein
MNTFSAMRVALSLLLCLCVSCCPGTAVCETRTSSAMDAGVPSLRDSGDGARGLKTTFLASAFFLGSVAALLEIESDRTYSRYLDVADPIKMDSLYEEAELYRNLSSAAFVAAEICAVAFVIVLVRERPEDDARPGKARLTLSAGSSGVGVSLLW